MKYGHSKGLLPKEAKNRLAFMIISTTLIAALLAGLYLSFAWNKYQRMAKSPEADLVEQTLTRLVEITDSVYYEYILKQQDAKMVVVADSSGTNCAASRPAGPAAV